MALRFRCLRSCHAEARRWHAQLISLACRVFVDIDPVHVLSRLERYQYLCLAVDGENLAGFLFISEHSERDLCLMGVRFAVVAPEYRERSLTRRLCLAFWLRWVPRRIGRWFRNPRCRFLVVTRICSPHAFASFSIGQPVEPDLLTGRPWPGKESPREIRCLIRDRLGFDTLDVETGQIPAGAVSAGIHPQNTPWRDRGWALPWFENVAHGNEIVAFCRIDSVLLFRLLVRVSRRWWSGLVCAGKGG